MAKRSPLGALSQAHRQVIAELYEQCNLSRDDLPYTPEFEELHSAFTARTGMQLTQHDFWRALAGIGKGSGLPRKQR